MKTYPAFYGIVFTENAMGCKTLPRTPDKSGPPAFETIYRQILTKSFLAGVMRLISEELSSLPEKKCSNIFCS
jgi:hypothetical protein